MPSLEAATQKALDSEDWTSAEEFLLLTLRIQEGLSGVESLDITEPLFNLGLFYFARNDYERAEKHLLKCLAIERRELAPGDRSLAETVKALTAIHVEKYLNKTSRPAKSA